MNLINKIKSAIAPTVIVAVVFASCNKAPDAPVSNVIPANPASGTSLAATITANADDSLFNRLLIRGGVQALLTNTLNRYTVYVPNNAAMRNFVNAVSGGAVPVGAPDATHSAFINTNVPVATAAGIASYNIAPQVVTSSTITSSFPNFAYPSIINPNPAASPFLRLDHYPSKRANGAWINNIPLVPGLDVAAANGVIHHTAAVSTPPSAFLWSRIDTDLDYEYLREAILRADSGTTFTPGTLNANNLQSVLREFGPNLTVFAPRDQAFIDILTLAIYQALIRQGATPGPGTLATATAIATATDANGKPTVFRNPALFGALTAQTVKGILVYHILGNRAFSVNVPTTATGVPTLLNGVLPTHPGVTVTATFTGPVVSALTVKGSINTTASNVIINTLPNPFGTSDQHFVNGVLHKIDQVLLPLPL